MWSLTQSDANPASSSRRAIAGMPSVSGNGPLFGSLAPMRRSLNVEYSTTPLPCASSGHTGASRTFQVNTVLRAATGRRDRCLSSDRRALVRIVKLAITEGGAERDTDFVQSLQRGLAVIRAFDADDPALTLSDVAKATGLAPATARRFVLTLVELGYMRAEGRLFRLSPRVLELGRPYLSSLTLPEIALPHLRDFVADVRESSSLAILDGSDIVYVAHVAAKRIMSVSVSVGTRDPAFATSLGRVLLAGQSDEWLARVAWRRCSWSRSRARRSSIRMRCCAELRGSASRAGRSSIRSSRRGCARWRRRSTTSTGT